MNIIRLRVVIILLPDDIYCVTPSIMIIIIIKALHLCSAGLGKDADHTAICIDYIVTLLRLGSFNPGVIVLRLHDVSHHFISKCQLLGEKTSKFISLEFLFPEGVPAFLTLKAVHLKCHPIEVVSLPRPTTSSG